MHALASSESSLRNNRRASERSGISRALGSTSSSNFQQQLPAAEKQWSTADVHDSRLSRTATTGGVRAWRPKQSTRCMPRLAIHACARRTTRASARTGLPSRHGRRSPEWRHCWSDRLRVSRTWRRLQLAICGSVRTAQCTKGRGLVAMKQTSIQDGIRIPRGSPWTCGPAVAAT